MTHPQSEPASSRNPTLLAPPPPLPVGHALCAQAPHDPPQPAMPSRLSVAPSSATELQDREPSPLLRALALGRRVHATLARDGELNLRNRGRKEYSCRKLARLHGVPPSTLWRALAIYQLCLRHPELAQYQHVGVGHLSVLLGLPRQHQLHFLRRAENGRWSRTQLERQIRHSTLLADPPQPPVEDAGSAN